MQQSALYPLHQALGATFTTTTEWEMPQHFGDLQAEYQALRHGVGLCDLSHRGLVRVTGQDRQRFLHAGLWRFFAVLRWLTQKALQDR